MKVTEFVINKKYRRRESEEGYFLYLDPDCLWGIDTDSYCDKLSYEDLCADDWVEYIENTKLRKLHNFLEDILKGSYDKIYPLYTPAIEIAIKNYSDDASSFYQATIQKLILEILKIIEE